ncbi:MAG TPA: epoxyqueuosine reductase QueH, partial [Spirochaetota bacterium]|nr:epoxyqueuosine reductase QueH [Spirochaetota bacterium]HQK08259.1 epoxyqueuosine reductase QueH [Spirochaetota bacterium]
VCTTLSVSPYKDAEKINEIGRSFAELYGIQFIEADFKQNGGYQHSIVLSKQYGMYRQKYCGCVYSRLERNKNSLWSIKSNSYKKNMITANNKY